MKPILYRYKDTEAVIKVMDGYTPGDGWLPLYGADEVKAATDAALERAAIERLKAESDERLKYDVAREMEIARLCDALLEIGNMAHDASTGPTVPDVLWEIRNSAYAAIKETP